MSYLYGKCYLKMQSLLNVVAPKFVTALKFIFFLTSYFHVQTIKVF